MAETELRASTGGGSQTNTQSPQTASQPATAGAQSSSVQPGTANDLLSKQASGNTGGVPLSNQPLTTVGLSGSKKSAVTQVAKPIEQREINPALIAVPVVFLVAAVLVAVLMKRSVNNTTY